MGSGQVKKSTERCGAPDNRRWSRGEDGQLNSPAGIALGNHDDVYVTDVQASNGRGVQRFSTNGTFISKLGDPTTDEGKFRRPDGVAGKANDDVVVADYCRSNEGRGIRTFHPDGTLVSTFGSQTGPEGIGCGTTVAVGATEDLYVADPCFAGGHAVKHFTEDGEFIGTVGGAQGTDDGQFQCPYGVTLDGSGNVYVADYCRGQRNLDPVQKFDADGQFVTKFGGPAEGQQNFCPFTVSVNASGSTVLVPDLCHMRVGGSSTARSSLP